MNTTDTLTIRPISADDKQQLTEGFERLSERSRYRRFLAGHRRLSAAELSYLTEVDHHDHEALVAIDPQTSQGVGVARFVRSSANPDVAELAVAIVDDWQGQGVGSRLVAALADRAREEGITSFSALVLADNERMLNLLNDLGRVRVVHREMGTVELTVELSKTGLVRLKRLLGGIARGAIIPLARPLGQNAENSTEIASETGPGPYDRPTMHRDVVLSEFSHQSRSFDRAAVMSSAETLGALLELVPNGAGGRWLDVACGTGVVTRALAGEVDEVLGIDLTAAMLDVGRREARSAGLPNVAFESGDATALALPAESFDGAVTRFSLHHIPVPRRVITELARVVRPGGLVIIGDHVSDEDAAGAAWHQEIERLRDPSHWSCLSPARIRAVGESAGLRLDEERLIPIELDFDEWLARSSAGADHAELISACLAERPEGTASFKLVERDGSRRLQLVYFLTRWQRP